MKRFKVWISALLILLFTGGCTSAAISPTVLSATISSQQNYDSTNKILFMSSAMTGGWQLFTINPDGTDLKQITNLANFAGGFTWSPNGQYIAFITFSGGLGISRFLNVMRSDGSEIHQLTDDINQMTWSPDNKQIAFTTSRRSGISEIYVMSRDGGDIKPLTQRSSDNVSALSWSPGGKQIAFIRLHRLYIVNADGTSEKQVVSGDIEIQTVEWSPDGQRLGLVVTQNQHTGIYSMKPDGSDVQKIIDIASDDAKLDWSPDGMHLLYTQKIDDDVSLFVVGNNGQNNHQLPTSRGSWSPDSQHIVYEGLRGYFQSSLSIMDLNGQDQTSLSGNNMFDLLPLWSPR